MTTSKFRDYMKSGTTLPQAAMWVIGTIIATAIGYAAIKQAASAGRAGAQTFFAEKWQSGEESRFEALAENAALKVTVRELEKLLQGGVIEQSAMVAHSPFPIWIKELIVDESGEIYDSSMLYLNNAYTKEFGFTLYEYAGRSDEDMWGEVGREFLEEDIKVVLSRRAEVSIQRVDSAGYEWALVAKYPAPIKMNTTKMFVAGILIPTRYIAQIIAILEKEARPEATEIPLS